MQDDIAIEFFKSHTLPVRLKRSIEDKSILSDPSFIIIGLRRELERKSLTALSEAF